MLRHKIQDEIACLMRLLLTLSRYFFWQGTVGKVLMVDVKKGKVVVEGVNIKTKHVKPMKEGETGRIMKREGAIHISNIKRSDAAPAPAA